MMGQNPLAITNQPGKVQYGDSFTLSTTGGSGTGEVTWSVTVGGDIAHIDGNGLVTLYKAGGPVTVKATKAADSGYASSEATWTFSVAKKPVKAIVTADDKVYDGSTPAAATIHITWKDGDLVGGDTIDLDSVLTGTFDNPNVGTNKKVTISGSKPANEKYDISWNTTTTASITPKTATVNGVTAKTNLVYNGQPQVLVNAGNTDSGNVVYSLDSGATYLLDPPSATNAGTYTVWYKAESGSNYEDSAAKAVSVTIKPKEVTSPVIELSPNTFNYDGNPKKPDVVVKDGTTLIPASEYAVSYSDNVAASDNAKVTINDNPGGNYTVSGTATFTIESGAATLTQAPQERELAYTGNPQALVTAGSAVNGRVVYSIDDGETYSTTIPKGTN
ncbi:MAG: hypothetical protein K2K53_08040, partial [Oscillospiraceae bacterium]|nr:hypothetical protein [Oscillospiraceae bacterium]